MAYVVDNEAEQAPDPPFVVDDEAEEAYRISPEEEPLPDTPNERE